MNILKAIWNAIVSTVAKSMNENAIYVLKPYVWNDTWVFDDKRVGLEKEAFVQGIPEIFAAALAAKKISMAKAKKGFKLLFSAHAFPGYQVKLVRGRKEAGGYWYKWPQKKLEGWLCPALFKYYNSAPDALYFSVSHPWSKKTPPIKIGG